MPHSGNIVFCAMPGILFQRIHADIYVTSHPVFEAQPRLKLVSSQTPDGNDALHKLILLLVLDNDSNTVIGLEVVVYIIHSTNA
jgi:hypothetical protein